eukprot:jgi/Picsp_1/1597/NSC_05075-R1_ankyrin repeat-containing
MGMPFRESTGEESSSDDPLSNSEGPSEFEGEIDMSRLEHLFDEELMTDVAAIFQSEESSDSWVDPSRGSVLSILHRAIEHGHTSVVRRLLPLLTVPLDTLGVHGDSALHLAALFGRLDITEILLDEGHPATTPDAENGLALHDAAAGGFAEIARLLLDKAPDTVSARDMEGDTPLHNAARGEHMAMVWLLLRRGASPRAANGQGLLPEELATDGSSTRHVLQIAARGEHTSDVD